MASRRKRASHGLGSYDREYELVEESIDSLLSGIERSTMALSRLHNALETGSASQAFHGKRGAQDALADLTKRLHSAQLTESTRARQLDHLPHHSPFTKAHEAARELRTLIERAERTRRRLVKVSYGDPERMREGLVSGDPSRRYAQPTRDQQAYIHRKIRILRREHPRWSQKQVVAVAYSMAGVKKRTASGFGRPGKRARRRR